MISRQGDDVGALGIDTDSLPNAPEISWVSGPLSTPTPSRGRGTPQRESKQYWTSQPWQPALGAALRRLRSDPSHPADHPDKQVQRLGHDLMRQVKRVFQHWRHYQQGKIRWGTFRRDMSPVRQEINA